MFSDRTAKLKSILCKNSSCKVSAEIRSSGFEKTTDFDFFLNELATTCQIFSNSVPNSQLKSIPFKI